MRLAGKRVVSADAPVPSRWPLRLLGRRPSFGDLLLVGLEAPRSSRSLPHPRSEIGRPVSKTVHREERQPFKSLHSSDSSLPHTCPLSLGPFPPPNLPTSCFFTLRLGRDPTLLYLLLRFRFSTDRSLSARGSPEVLQDRRCL